MQFQLLVTCGLLALALSATVPTRPVPGPSTTKGTTRLTRFTNEPTEDPSTTKPVVSTKSPTAAPTKGPSTKGPSTMAPATTDKPATTVGPTPSTPAPIRNVLDAVKAAGATQFHDFVELTNLKNVLTQEGPFTIFAPSNDAFDEFDSRELVRIISNNERLYPFLAYHCAFGALSSDLVRNDITANTLSGTKLRFNIYNINNETVVTAGGSSVSTFDVRAPNGVVHIVDRIIYPEPAGNIPETLARVKDFERLSELLQLSTFVDKLAGAEPLTFFAPTKEAIEKLRPDEIAIIIANQDLLDELLMYHTVAGTVHDIALVDGATLNAMTNETITVSEFLGVKSVNGARIDPQNSLAATNGVIHGISSFMDSPENIIKYIKRTMKRTK